MNLFIKQKQPNEEKDFGFSLDFGFFYHFEKYHAENCLII